MTSRAEPRRRRKGRHTGRWALVACAVAALVPAFLAFRQAPAGSDRGLIESGEGIEAADLRAAHAPLDAVRAAPARPVYRYSIVPGGVMDGTEMRAAAVRDSVVRAHYDGIRLEAVRTRILVQPRMRYTSYRVGDRIYWTRQPVALREGETVLDDGANQVRARCGNLISKEPRTPTFDNEPPTTVFDEIIPRAPLAILEPAPVGDSPAPPAHTPAPGVAIAPPPIGNPPLLVAPPGSSAPGGDIPRAGGGAPFVLFGLPPWGSSGSPGGPDRPQGPHPGTPPSDGQGSAGGQDKGGPPPHPPSGGGSGGGGQAETPSGPGDPIVIVSDDPILTDDPGSETHPPDPPREKPVQVPEPATLMLLGIGGAVVARRHWRARR